MQRMNSGELCGFGNERGKADLTVGRAFVQRSSVWGIYKLLNLHSEQRAPQGAAAREILRFSFPSAHWALFPF